MNLAKNRATLWQALAFAALGAFTGWLRLRELGHSQFSVDQSSMLGIALGWLNGGSFPLTSVKTSIGIFHPPLVEYLMALPLAFTRDLLGVVWLTALINLAGLAAAGWTTARVFGWRVAWWAVLLFAVNPWAAYYARYIWSQSFVPGFSALAYACLIAYLTTDRRPWLLVTGIAALAAAVQLHLAAAALIIALIPPGIVLRDRLPIRPLAIGAGLAALIFLPYIWFQVSTGFADAGVLLAGDGQPAVLNADSVLYSLDLFISGGIFPTAGAAADQWQALNAGWQAADLLVTVGLAAVLAASLAYVIIDWRRHPHLTSLRSVLPPPRQPGDPQGHRVRGGDDQRSSEGVIVRGPRQLSDQATAELVMLCWTIIPVLLSLRHSQHMQNYYFIYLYPVPLVLMARLADRAYLWSKSWLANRWGFPAGRTLVACIAFLPLALIGLQQARLDVTGQDLLASGAAGRLRVVDMNQAISTTRDLMADRPGCTLVIVSKGGSVETSNMGLLREALSPTPVRFVEAGAGMLIPARCAIYFLNIDNRRAAEWLDANTLPLPFTSTADPTRLWRFADLPPDQRDAAAIKWMDRLPLADWGAIRLMTAQSPPSRAAGQMLPLVATWEVFEPDPARPLINWGNYLLTADNQVAAQIDGPGVDSREWQSGDLFETVFRVELPPDLPPGEYRLATALYRSPSLERLALADGLDLFFWGTVTITAP